MKRVEISGFGGHYENACQRMLSIGLEWIKDKPLSIWEGVYSYKGIFGILHTTDKFHKLEERWEEIAPSGAMHQAVLQHLYYIHKYGYEAWLNNFKDHIFDWDENAPTHLESPKQALWEGFKLGMMILTRE